jgi:[acyl-carrier-protein] S-malonyltransferase
MSAGIVFPGMGPSRYADLAKFIVTDPRARRLRRTVDDVLGYPLMDLYKEAGSDYSEYSQVAFLISCLALAERAGEKIDTEPEVCTGPSFGGKAAIAYSGSLSIAETILLVARLARCEEDYFRGAHTDVITQSVARTPEPELRAIVDAMLQRGEWCEISCYIDTDFFMVTMRERGLEYFLREVRACGGLPVYAMRPPMHSCAFEPLRRRAEDEVFRDFRFSDPRIPIVSDLDGSLIDTADGARTMLLSGIVRPVNWPASVRAMKAMGVTKIVIPGPDSLFGRVYCTISNFTVVPLNPLMALRPRIPLIPWSLNHSGDSHDYSRTA